MTRTPEQRTKDLDAALAGIEKQFGKGSVMKLGDASAVRIPAIPTGALSLDLALGIGGVPRGRVTEIYGPESSGKCLTAGTYVWTDHGTGDDRGAVRPRRPARVLHLAGHRRLATTAFGWSTRRPGSRPMAAVTHNNRKPVWRVVLDVRPSRRGDRQPPAAGPQRARPHRVAHRGGAAGGRRPRLGAVRRRDGHGGSAPVRGRGRPAGLPRGRGHARRARPQRGRVHQRPRPGRLRRVRAPCSSRVLGIVAGPCPDLRGQGPQGPRHGSPSASRRRVRARLHRTPPTRSSRTLVRTGGAKIQRAFLSALYEGDGWIEQGPRSGCRPRRGRWPSRSSCCCTASASRRSLRTRHNDELDRDYHTVLVPPGSVHRFLDAVGFRSDRRAAQVERHLQDSAPNTQLEHIPVHAQTCCSTCATPLVATASSTPSSVTYAATT